MTSAEKRLWRRIRNRQLGFKFRRQMPIASYIADFACPAARLIIEIDGDSHADGLGQLGDVIRTTSLEYSGYRVMRIWNGQVFENLDGVVEGIWNELHREQPAVQSAYDPSPPPRPSPYEGEGTLGQLASGRY
jgi:very-short-patch-repair endonuclease